VLQAALYTASLYWPLRREIRRFQPDVLLSAWAYPDGTAAAAFGQIFDLPTVCRVMGTDINDFTKRADRRPQIALAFRHTDRVIAVSQALGDVVASLGVDRDKIVQIPTGVDTERFHAVDRISARDELGLPLEAPLIAVPSRLSPEKGIHHLLAALPRMRSNVHVVLVGDGDQRAELEEQTARLGLGTRVHFAGYQLEHRMKLFYSAADLTCLPSLEEGWPDALMEAFACGCPVVASDVGGVADIIELTGAGLLAPPGDPEGLSRVLGEALERDWDREATAAQMQNHTLAATAERYVETCASAAAR
jgi:glycosyltransferase involved in cell wall biosynthesis